MTVPYLILSSKLRTSPSSSSVLANYISNMMDKISDLKGPSTKWYNHIWTQGLYFPSSTRDQQFILPSKANHFNCALCSSLSSLLQDIISLRLPVFFCVIYFSFPWTQAFKKFHWPHFALWPVLQLSASFYNKLFERVIYISSFQGVYPHFSIPIKSLSLLLHQIYAFKDINDLCVAKSNGQFSVPIFLNNCFSLKYSLHLDPTTPFISGSFSTSLVIPSQYPPPHLLSLSAWCAPALLSPFSWHETDIQSHGFKYHRCASDSQTYIFSVAFLLSILTWHIKCNISKI